MTVVVLLVVLVVTLTELSASGGHYRAPDAKDYCEWESFNATCSPDEVVLVESARYGRMSRGRCVTKNYGHIGCGTDVKPFFRAKCSGRRNCVIRIIDLHNKRSCPKDFKLYVEASFSCLKVHRPERHACPHAGMQHVFTEEGHLSSLVSTETGVGFANCPWVLHAHAHQRINITLLQFARSTTIIPVADVSGDASPFAADDRHYSQQQQSCAQPLALIRERPTGNNVTICASSHTETHVYLSSGGTVYVQLLRMPAPLNDRPVFLLRHKTVGCPPLDGPANSWIEQTWEDATVRCNETNEAWYLTCRGTDWVGNVGNCSADSAGTEGSWMIGGHFLGNPASFPFGLLIVVALGVAIGVAIGLVMLVSVLAYMKRRRRRRVQSRSNYLLRNVDKTKSSETCTEASSPMLMKRDHEYYYTPAMCATYSRKHRRCESSQGAAANRCEGSNSPTHQEQHAGLPEALPVVFTTASGISGGGTAAAAEAHHRRSQMVQSPVLHECPALAVESPYYLKFGEAEVLPDGTIRKPDLLPGCSQCSGHSSIHLSQHSIV